jgi:hypothetical protein
MVLGGSSGTGLAAQTNGSFICYGFDMLIQSVGASGKAIGMGTVSLASSVQVGVGTLYFTSGLGSAIAQVTVDTTAALAVDLRATWSVADPLNSVRVLGAVVEILG